MSGKVAKLERRADRLTEAVIQAHDRLHKDDVYGCHEMLHRALGSGQLTSDVAPLSGLAGFDAAFRDLCMRSGVRASFVLATPAEDGHTRLVSGGDAELDNMVTSAVRAVANP